jgi:hypothetical protein
MFTFGRAHEKKCEASYVRNRAQVPLLMRVIDAVHDRIEGIGSEEELRDALRVAMVEGGAGVWENSGRWLRKASQDYPGLLSLWTELARHSKAQVRFRIACFLDEMPDDAFAELAPVLVADRSTMVATRAADQIARRGVGRKGGSG